MLLARAHKYFLLDFHNRPMDPDIVPGKAYYDILVDIGWTLDFLMPQYYNGIILPLRDGFGPNSPGIAHYNNIKDNVFGGDATKIVFGFCISDCSLTGTNTDAASAVNILGDLEQSHSCHGGAFFWVVAHDINGAWSNTVANALLPNIGCSSNPSPPSPIAPTPTPPSPTAPTPTPPSPSPPTDLPSTELADNRMVAYMGNWQACPSTQQAAAYSHIVIAFAVSYVWNPGKNICSTTCEIATPPVCNNAANPGLIKEWQDAGKKVLLSFGGAGMGGSWDGNNDCWEYCFGRETQVINRITDIVNEMGLDGVDLDYEYYYEDGQNGSNFSKGAQAQKFIKDVTVGLRNSLDAGSIIAHA